MGGEFNYIGPLTGGGAMLKASDASLLKNVRIKGSVRAVVADGRGGWFIGGDFKEVQGIPRPGIAHILHNYTLDTDWTLDIVYAGPNKSIWIDFLTVDNNILYIKGRFISINGKSRNGVAAIDLSNRQVSDWNPEPVGGVDFLLPHKSIVFVGGSFTSIGKKARQYLAAVDAKTGEALEWNPVLNGSVRKLQLVDKFLYIVGRFNTIDGQSRRSLASFDIQTYQVTSWNPELDGSVASIAASQDIIYVNGLFTKADGQERQNLAAFNALDGGLTDWNPIKLPLSNPNYLTLEDNTLYVAEGNHPGTTVDYIIAIDATTGERKRWDPGVNGLVHCLAASENLMFIGGDFTGASGRNCHNLAAIDLKKGIIMDWCTQEDKGVRGKVSKLFIDKNTVYIAGAFSEINGKLQHGIGAIDASTGELIAWDPKLEWVNNRGETFNSLVSVDALTVKNDIMYIGGRFSSVGGITRNNVAAIDIIQKKVTSWSPKVNGDVNNLISFGNLIYIGGNFSKVNEQNRHSLASVSQEMGLLTEWNPKLESRIQDNETNSARGWIYKLRISKHILYASGYFTHINNQKRDALAAFNTTTGEVTAWDPSEAIETIGLHEHNLTVIDDALHTVHYVDIGINWDPQNRPIALDVKTGHATNWRISPLPYFDGGITYVQTSDSYACVTGLINDYYSWFGYSTQCLPFTFQTYKREGETENKAINFISGTVYKNSNEDCVVGDIAESLPDIVVVAEPGPYYGLTDSLGNYSIAVDSGSYTVRQILPSNSEKLIEQICPAEPETHTVQFSGYDSTVTGLNFANRVTLRPYLTVNAGSDRRRRCFSGTTTLSYCNSGSAPALDIKVYLQLPEHVVFIRADHTYQKQQSNTYAFDVGTLAPGQCGTIQLTDSVVCDNPDIRGLTQCTKVWISPANTIASDPKWDQSNISLTARCLDNGRIRLNISNNGAGAMMDSSSYRIFLDSEIVFARHFKLISGDSLILQVPANGQTVRLEVDQRVGHPTKQQSNITLEACGTNAAGKVSLGHVAQLPQDDVEPEVDVDCLPITDSFDPNDKLVTPSGVSEAHITPIGTSLEYTIRFQNTGNDYAYRVVVVDTLAKQLDISTLQMGAVSHPYQLTVSGKGRPVLTWTFDNINLPDSNRNEPQSHGYIKFSVKPLPDLLPRTVVSNLADIFFDYNPPVRTNTVINTLFDLPLPVSNSRLVAICQEETPVLTLTGQNSLQCSISNGTYRWFVDGEPLPITSQVIALDKSGDYTVRVDKAGCLSPLSSAYSYRITGLEPAWSKAIRVIPNPTEGECLLKVEGLIGSPLAMTLLDVLGRLMWEKQVMVDKGIFEQPVDLRHYVKGVYLLTIKTAQGVTTKRIMVR